LSGSRAGQWIGGRTKNNKIFLFFRLIYPSKAKKFILRLLNNLDIFSDAKIRIKVKINKMEKLHFDLVASGRFIWQRFSNGIGS
jgi:hypothetical protein